MARTQSGLGRGLAALIPDAEAVEHEHLDRRDQLQQRVMSAAFDLLEDADELAFCAYLHAPRDAEPHLWLRQPGFGTLTPTRAFRLFHQLALLSNQPDPSGWFEWEGRPTVYFRTEGPMSDGLFAVAASTGMPDAHDRRTIGTICRLFSHLTHQLQTRRPDGSVAADAGSITTIDLRTEPAPGLDSAWNRPGVGVVPVPQRS